MSFAGHVFDMIRRNKEDREKLSQLRGRGKDMRAKYSSHIPDISVEEFEKINLQLDKRKQDEQHYISQMKFFILIVALIIIATLWVILKFLHF